MRVNGFGFLAPLPALLLGLLPACAGDPTDGAASKQAAIAQADAATAEADDGTTTTPDTASPVADSAAPDPAVADVDPAEATQEDAAEGDADEDAAGAPDVDDATDDAQSPADTVACAPPPEPIAPATLPPAAFTDITPSLGIDAGANHAACVAAADFDLNGREDFVVIERKGNSATIHAVLLGEGAPVHVLSKFDTTVMHPDFGCSAVDMDGDAKADLLFGGYSGAALYLGDGKGGFVDKSAEWLPFVTDFDAFSPLPIDLDGDGDLDLYIGAGFDPPPCTSLKCQFTASDLVCEVDPPLAKTPALQDRVLIREQTLPLVDQTAAWKVPAGGTQTVAMALDVDFDGKLDVLVGDDMGSHRLLHNTGKDFVAFDKDIGFHGYAGAMGWGVGDFNGDGLFDLVLAESGPTPMYLQESAKPGKPLHFCDKGGKLGVWWPTWGASAWAPMVADFDHDGRDDLALGISVNFSPQKAANFMDVCNSSRMNPGTNPFAGDTSIDVLFLQEPGKGLVPLAMPAGAYPHVVLLDQRMLDLDGDGDLDLVQSRPGPTMQPTSRIRVLRNDLPKKGESVRIVVQGKGGNQDALGTTVTAVIGGKLTRRWLNGSGSWGGTPHRFAHFGLGGAATAQAVTVTWPDGSKTVLGDVGAGKTATATWQ